MNKMAVSIHLSVIGAPEYIKGGMDSKVIGGEFNTSLESMDRLSSHKLRKETVV